MLDVGYDPGTGQVASVADPDGGTIRYSHDGSLLTSEQYTGVWSQTVSWTYDANLRPITETVGGVSRSFGYDADGLLTSAGAATLTRQPQSGFLDTLTVGAVSTSLTYHTDGALATMISTRGGTTLASFSYGRDDLDRIVSVTETIAGITRELAYTYDLAGRLETVREGGVEIARYDYDDNGNRTAVTTSAGTSSASFDAQDRLTSHGDLDFEYDVTGELLRRIDNATSALVQFEYDSLGQLREVELADATVISYAVDPRGRRVARSVDGVLERGWVYRDELEPVAETDADGDIVTRFVYGSLPHVPDYIERDGNVYRVIVDHLGSVRLVVDVATGTIAQRLDYGPWGEVLLDTNVGFQPFGFAGGLYDPDTGLVHFGARDYDPSVGRWISKDPILFDGGDNLYVYVGDDPINNADPSGLAAPIAGAALAACLSNPACAGFLIGALGTISGYARCVASGLCNPHFPDFDWPSFDFFPQAQPCPTGLGDAFKALARRRFKPRVLRRRPDTPECDAEWESAIERCEQLLSTGWHREISPGVRGNTTDALECAAGLVSREFGGL